MTSYSWQIGLPTRPLCYNAPMSAGDILIAEDDAVLRNLYIKKFSVEGFTIRTAENGEEVLKELAQQKPDVLILDIHMPVMDGFQTMEKLPKPRPYPVIMLTNFADDATKARAKELGADDYFVKKDMTIRTLLEMVHRVMGMQQYKKQ